jgi:hypothetical protein
MDRHLGFCQAVFVCSWCIFRRGLASVRRCPAWTVVRQALLLATATSPLTHRGNWKSVGSTHRLFHAMHIGFAVKYLNETGLSHKHHWRKLFRSHVNNKLVWVSASYSVYSFSLCFTSSTRYGFFSRWPYDMTDVVQRWFMSVILSLLGNLLIQ